MVVMSLAFLAVDASVNMFAFNEVSLDLLNAFLQLVLVIEFVVSDEDGSVLLNSGLDLFIDLLGDKDLLLSHGVRAVEEDATVDVLVSEAAPVSLGVAEEVVAFVDVPELLLIVEEHFVVESEVVHHEDAVLLVAEVLPAAGDSGNSLLEVVQFVDMHLLGEDPSGAPDEHEVLLAIVDGLNDVAVTEAHGLTSHDDCADQSGIDQTLPNEVLPQPHVGPPVINILGHSSRETSEERVHGLNK